MSEVLAFDWGTTIVGVLDVNADIYRAYRSCDERMESAQRIVDCTGTIISFNGSGLDLFELVKILGLPPGTGVVLKGAHHDMMSTISAIRWPPDPGTAPILGPNLAKTYRYYSGDVLPAPPPQVAAPYEVSNWLDCTMTAALWSRWQRGDLRQ